MKVFSTLIKVFLFFIVIGIVFALLGSLFAIAFKIALPIILIYMGNQKCFRNNSINKLLIALGVIMILGIIF